MKNLKLTISALVLVGIALMSYGAMSFADENNEASDQKEEKFCKDNSSPPTGFSNKACEGWFRNVVMPTKTSCPHGIDDTKPIACTGTTTTCFPAIGTGKGGQYCSCTFICKEPKVAEVD